MPPTDRASFEDLIAGRCVDPHAVLGMHETPDGLLVRTLQAPDARPALVLENGSELPMSRVHSGGVFEHLMPGPRARFPYRLAIDTKGGRVARPDPYAFGPSVGALDLHLAAEGTHRELYRRLGSHVREHEGAQGVAFAVWAPRALGVRLLGQLNEWTGLSHPMRRLGGGIWELFVPGIGAGELYKYEIVTEHGRLEKVDPFARAAELRPDNASRVTTSSHRWDDAAWLARRAKENPTLSPMSIYEVHLGSWRRRDEPGPGAADGIGSGEGKRWLTYRELAHELVDYVADLGFTHIELMPVLEHPFDGSWGYQVVGYFAPTRRYGEPDDLKYFIARCHARGIGVILDWVPAHFPKDAWALARFDGEPLYEPSEAIRAEHRQWGTLVFDYARAEVQNFLLASARYWFDEFHVDGLRVDAVASLLYIDYAAAGGEWLPNQHGGRENLEAIALIRALCDMVHKDFPGAIVAAEESSAWPGVTRPTYLGGLGFDFKWNMGWMHDTLDYFSLDPIHRSFHHRMISFGLMYAFNEAFVLPLSHDEVVHLKRSLIKKMPGDRWQMMASLRSLYAYMWAHPGKKLLFMGGEIAQWEEWSFAGELDWARLDEEDHRGVSRLIGDLNRAYTSLPALFEADASPLGFRWIDANDAQQSVVSFIRYPASNDGKRPTKGQHVVFIGNFTPIPRIGYRVGVPRPCRYAERINTDATHYGGSSMGNYGSVAWEDVPSHEFPQSIVVTLPPLSGLWLVPEDASIPDREAPAAPRRTEHGHHASDLLTRVLEAAADQPETTSDEGEDEGGPA